MNGNVTILRGDSPQTGGNLTVGSTGTPTTTLLNGNLTVGASLFPKTTQLYGDLTVSNQYLFGRFYY